MISRQELEKISRLKKYKLGQAEVDYMQDIVLFILYNEFGKELVFKGGTALTKCYGFNRFSEDLDFTASEKKEFRQIITNGLKDFYIDAELEEKAFDRTITIIIHAKGPLYNGNPRSTCKIILDISLREPVILEPNKILIGLHTREVPDFSVIVMSEEEILAEKVRTILSRNEARDVYDLYYLTKKISVNHQLIEKKLKYYDLDMKDFKDALKKKQVLWTKELPMIVTNIPEFKIVEKEILKKIKAH